MNPFGWIGATWRLARPRQLVQGRYAAQLYIFLLLLFGIVAVVLLLMGFDLESVDRWLDGHGGAIRVLADWLWRIFMGLVFLLAIGTAFSMAQDWYRRRNNAKLVGQHHEDVEAPSGCLFLAALGVAVFAWLGMAMDY